MFMVNFAKENPLIMSMAMLFHPFLFLFINFIATHCHYIGKKKFVNEEHAWD